MLVVTEVVRLGHNTVSSLQGLVPALAPFMLCQTRLDALLLLDLSHNRIRTLDADVLDCFPGLQVDFQPYCIQYILQLELMSKDSHSLWGSGRFCNCTRTGSTPSSSSSR